MSALTIVGIGCLILAVIWIGYRVHLAYNSFGGTVVVTLYDAAFYPPVLATFGLNRVLLWQGVDWPLWVYACIWVGLVALVVGMIRLAERLGDREVW